MPEGQSYRSSRQKSFAPLFWGPTMLLAIGAISCVGSVTRSNVPGGAGGTSLGTTTGTTNGVPNASTGGGLKTGSTSPAGNGGATVAVGGDTGAGGATSLPVGPLGGGTASSCVKRAIGPSLLRRLTHTEYDNSVADLLGDKTTPSLQFPRDVDEGIFDNTATAQSVPELLASGYVDAAATLAGAIPNLATLVGCDFTTANGATCVGTFVSKFGRRAFRRPLTTDEATRLTAIFNSSPMDKQLGVRAVITAILTSPHFLFRPEFGSAASPTIDGAMTLAPFEMAARLSSLLWASVPDDVLLDEAQAGRLTTPDQVATQARRMLAMPRANTAIAAFYDQWFGMSMLDAATKNPAVYQFDDTLRTSMEEETRRFVANVIWTDDGRLSTLLSAPYTFVNAPLAALYGVKGPADATTYTQVMLDPTQRAGMLTHGSMLAAFAGPDQSSPAKRGKWVRTRLLCNDLPDPPNDVPPLPDLQPGVSNRARFEMHTSVMQCSGCHGFIDGLGFGLEAYDGIGRVRTLDNGVPVDNSGQVTNTIDINGPYTGGPQLAALLARSTQVRDCAATQWMRYAMARREGPDDVCSLEAIHQTFAASGGNLKDLMVSLTQTDAFLNYRKAD